MPLSGLAHLAVSSFQHPYSITPLLRSSNATCHSIPPTSLSSMFSSKSHQWGWPSPLNQLLYIDNKFPGSVLFCDVSFQCVYIPIFNPVHALSNIILGLIRLQKK